MQTTLIVLIAVLGCNMIVINCNPILEERNKRDIQEALQNFGMNVAGKALDLLSQGMSVQSEHHGGANIMGTQLDGGYDFKGGFGNAMYPAGGGTNNYREKRSPCRRDGAAPTSSTTIRPPATTVAAG